MKMQELLFHVKDENTLRAFFEQFDIDSAPQNGFWIEIVELPESKSNQSLMWIGQVHPPVSGRSIREMVILYGEDGYAETIECEKTEDGTFVVRIPDSYTQAVRKKADLVGLKPCENYNHYTDQIPWEKIEPLLNWDKPAVTLWNKYYTIPQITQLLKQDSNEFLVHESRIRNRITELRNRLRKYKLDYLIIYHSPRRKKYRK